MSDLCFITTCRGRLSSLQQSLPTIVAQGGTSCIVVDYDCPQGTADWVAANHPQVRIVRDTGRPRFEISRARNLGAEVAESPWFCFVDADVRLTPHFAESVRPLLKAGHYYRPHPRSGDLWGFCICRRDDFHRIEGYDDVLQGWGKDDGDLYTRLQMVGVRPALFPGDLTSTIPHNHVYCRAKWDLMKLWHRNLPRSMREKLYQQFHKAIIAAHADGKPIELSIPVHREDTWSCGPLEARLVYRLPQPSGDGRSPQNATDAASD